MPRASESTATSIAPSVLASTSALGEIVGSATDMRGHRSTTQLPDSRFPFGVRQPNRAVLPDASAEVATVHVERLERYSVVHEIDVNDRRNLHVPTPRLSWFR